MSHPLWPIELIHENTPADVRGWMSRCPGWLEIRRPSHGLDLELGLDAGELEAIALAEELEADLLLVDDWDARREAIRRHIPVVGTLRVLADAASLGLTNLEEDFQRLLQTNFRVSRELLDSLFREQQERGAK